MWIAKPIYEPLPLIYMVVGAILVACGALPDAPFLELILVAAGILLLVVGLVLLLRRRAYRASRSRERYDQFS